MDNICGSFNFVGAGVEDRLHAGWRHACPAGHRHRRGAAPGYSRPQTSVNLFDVQQAIHERILTIPLIQLVIVLVVVGVILWVINSYIPMHKLR